MIYFNAFIFSGIVCFLGEIAYLKLKTSSAHITVFLVIVGCVLECFGLYSLLVEYCGGGATILIMNFGASLTRSGINQMKEAGLIGAFSGVIKDSSLILSSIIFLSVISPFVFKRKNK
ncbi:MAG: SpoVA/SpoVAEb family sporulation membrane protein [Bacillales bacterium]|nr:SpoVA/SpoVAEb family sporulation membrane protein [Bacillales bacterium]